MYLQWVIVFLVASIEAQYLPTYIGKCSARDENLNDCIVRKANPAIKKLQFGDVHYDIPFMNPLYIPDKIVLKESEEMVLTIKDSFVYGIGNTIMESVNFTGNFVSTVLRNPLLTILSNYEVNGRCLNVPIFGTGFLNVTLINGVFYYQQDLPPKYVDGETYLDSIDPQITHYATEKSIYRLDNLYNGDQYLGAYMNAYLNKNWRAVQSVLRPLASKAIANVLVTVSRGITNNVPLNEIFKP